MENNLSNINKFFDVDIDDAWLSLASAIFEQTVKDWRYLLKSGGQTVYYGKASLYEIRAFLRGEWAALLCSTLSVSPNAILDRLEKELKEAEKHDTYNSEKDLG